MSRDATILQGGGEGGGGGQRDFFSGHDRFSGDGTFSGDGLSTFSGDGLVREGERGRSLRRPGSPFRGRNKENYLHGVVR
jgi:hypothetical protein